MYRKGGLAVKRVAIGNINRGEAAARSGYATHEQWALDFISELPTARSMHILGEVDIFTRECVALEAGRASLA